MAETKDKDADLGQAFFLALHRLTERLAKRHGVPVERAADYLLAGSLFTAAHIYELSLDETIEVAQEIAESVQHDELPASTRH